LSGREAKHQRKCQWRTAYPNGIRKKRHGWIDRLEAIGNQTEATIEPTPSGPAIAANAIDAIRLFISTKLSKETGHVVLASTNRHNERKEGILACVNLL
jgi:hypothetical protein